MLLIGLTGRCYGSQLAAGLLLVAELLQWTAIAISLCCGRRQLAGCHGAVGRGYRHGQPLSRLPADAIIEG